MKTESAKRALFFCPLRAYLAAGCVIIQRSREKRAESQKTATMHPRVMCPRLIRARLSTLVSGSAYRVRAFVHRVQEAKAAAEKKQFCGLVPGLQPVKTAGALHPSAAEKNGRKKQPALRYREYSPKTALPGDGSQLRPWPPSAPRLARCACECARALGCGRFCL